MLKIITGTLTLFAITMNNALPNVRCIKDDKMIIDSNRHKINSTISVNDTMCANYCWENDDCYYADYNNITLECNIYKDFDHVKSQDNSSIFIMDRGYFPICDLTFTFKVKIILEIIVVSIFILICLCCLCCICKCFCGCYDYFQDCDCCITKRSCCQKNNPDTIHINLVRNEKRNESFRI